MFIVKSKKENVQQIGINNKRCFGMANYEVLSEEIARKLLVDDAGAVRRISNPHDASTAWRSAYIRDIDKIMHSAYYNRYADKTQVFSLYKNNDITRRALHVQFVSRIARTIGKALGLNLDLIEAIAVGHDIGHTPFGHAGESYLDELYFENAGRHFSHNIQSVRVLDGIFPLNLTLQTLSGIASHDGELELKEYKPQPLDFSEFDRQIELCYLDKANVKKLVPSTLEGCVVRISDIIAYLGKDRQDAIKAGLTPSYSDTAIGTINAEIINNLIVNIIENSYGKDYIALDDEHFEALKTAKAENYKLIYYTAHDKAALDENVKPMMADLYGQFKDDLKNNNLESPIFKHHIKQVNESYYRKDKRSYLLDLPDQIVVDFIASMTDNYFLDAYNYLFPENNYKIDFIDFF